MYLPEHSFFFWGVDVVPPPGGCGETKIKTSGGRCDLDNRNVLSRNNHIRNVQFERSTGGHLIKITEIFNSAGGGKISRQERQIFKQNLFARLQRSIVISFFILPRREVSPPIRVCVSYIFTMWESLF